MKTKDIVFIGLFVSLATAGAFIKVPLPFMSVTFQLFFAILAGIILGPFRGLFAMSLYLVIGLIGLPVFSLGGGPAYVLLPSFGFILGFIPAAFFSGLVYEKSRSMRITAVLPAYLAGVIAAYSIGIPYLYLIMKYYLNNPKATPVTVVASMLIYISKDIVLGLVLLFFSKHIPMLRNFARSQTKSP